MRKPAKKPSILQIGKFYPPHMGGIETHLEALCAALEDDVQIEVIVSSDTSTTTSERIGQVGITRVAQILTAASTAICPGMATAIRNTPADLVHLHVPNPMGAIAYLLSGHPGKLVITYHSDTLRQRLLGMLFQPILHHVLRKSSAIIATSRPYVTTSPILRQHQEKCHVISLGVNVRSVQEADPESIFHIRETFGPDIILGVGRLVYYKGFEHLIRAMQSCTGRLLLIGDGPLRGELEKLAADCNVSDRVVFLGSLKEDIRAYYHAAKVFVLPSIARTEAFGIVQIEAMAAGTPVINTQLDSGVPVVSLHGVTGLTVPPADPAALAAALNTLLSDEQLRLRFGAAAKARAGSEFTIETMAARILTLYAQVLNGGDSGLANQPIPEHCETGERPVLSAQD